MDKTITFNMSDLEKWTNQMSEAYEEREKKKYVWYKRIYSKKIKGSFLIKVLYAVRQDSEFFSNVTDWVPDYMVSNMLDYTSCDLEICNFIVGIHRSNTLLMAPDKVFELYKDDNYVSEIISRVKLDFKTRLANDRYFRPFEGDSREHYLYYPELRHLMVGWGILRNVNAHNIFSNADVRALYNGIVLKIMSVFSVVDYGVLENAYGLCRAAIEQYIVLAVLNRYPEGIESYLEFIKFKFYKSATDEYPEELYDLMNHNNIKSYYIHDYANYGWLDEIPVIRDFKNNMRYSFNTLVEFYKANFECENAEDLHILYKRCHGFTHGNTFTYRYPVIAYIEICKMLYYILRPLMDIVLNNNETLYVINGVNMKEVIDEDYKRIVELRERCTTEILETYYGKHS